MALSHYTAHLFLVTHILEDIRNSEEYGPLDLDQILSHFYVKSGGEWYMIYKGFNKPWIYLLPNRSHYLDDDRVYEIGVKHTSTRLPLTHTHKNTIGIYSLTLLFNILLNFSFY